MSDPFLLPPQSVVSFSGGRTSGYLLWRVLRANGGALPPDVVVIFNNTGKEREETLEFVRDCSERWGVKIHWLEYRWEPGRNYFAEVDFATASRNGEPFRQLIQARGFLPNQVMRFCTIELKIRTTMRFARQWLKWNTYFNAVGLRADEPKRVAKLMRRTVVVEQTLFGEEWRGERPVCPQAEAGVTNQDVLDFWAAQPFDLKLPVDGRTGKTLGGNCDLCFLKGAANIVDLIRERPESADWWIEGETLLTGKDGGKALFRADRPPYAELKRIALGMVEAPGWMWADKEGMACGEVIECNCTD